MEAQPVFFYLYSGLIVLLLVAQIIALRVDAKAKRDRVSGLPSPLICECEECEQWQR